VPQIDPSTARPNRARVRAAPERLRTIRLELQSAATYYTEDKSSGKISNCSDIFGFRDPFFGRERSNADSYIDASACRPGCTSPGFTKHFTAE
jgi:hypothetical protein